MKKKIRSAYEAGMSVLYKPNLHVETNQNPLVITDPRTNDPRIQGLRERLPFLEGVSDIPFVIIADTPKEDYAHRLGVHDEILR